MKKFLAVFSVTCTAMKLTIRHLMSASGVLSTISKIMCNTFCHYFFLFFFLRTGLGFCLYGALYGTASSYHFLQDQYLAVSLLGGLVSHLCLALKLLRRFGWSFLIDIFGSPNLTSLTLSPCFASTANFLDLPGVLLGLLYPENLSPL